MLMEMKIDGSSGDVRLEGCMAEIFYECFQLWKLKQKKYGPQNIAHIGQIGILQRALSDKGARIENMLLNGVQEDAEGSLADCWLDWTVYGAMGLCVLRGWWPGTQPRRLTLRQVLYVVKTYIGGTLWARKMNNLWR
uniref:Nucleotide modification associated domain-containing protein n=1 Tax=viral metagenome TaxID=1070528 RepID=A0A6M3L7X6_9ZZZZ